LLKRFKHFCGDESGATAIEYGLIAALVSVAAIGALTTMGNTLQTRFGTISNSMSTAVNGG
jgi:pilus assembly protein Flp/PilA